MKNVYVLFFSLLVTLVAVGCECTNGDKLDGSDLVVTNLEEAVSATTGNVWAVTCIIKILQRLLKIAIRP